MSNLESKINLKPFDPDKLHIEKDDAFAEAYVFQLELDSTPSTIWRECFTQEWRQSMYLLKRRAEIRGKYIRVVTAPDEIEGKIGWTQGLVEGTNKRIDEYNERLSRRMNLQDKERKKEKDTIEGMRDRLKKNNAALL